MTGAEALFWIVAAVFVAWRLCLVARKASR